MQMDQLNCYRMGIECFDPFGMILNEVALKLAEYDTIKIQLILLN